MLGDDDDPLVAALARAAREDPADLREPRRFGEAESDVDDDEADGDEVDADAGDAHGPMPHDGPQTGVKGVIADRRRGRREQAAREQAAAHQLRDRLARAALRPTRPAEDDADMDDEDEDDAFLEAYRAQRIAEMQRAQPARRVFGALPTVDAAGFVDAVEREDALVPVVVHVFDNRVAASQRMSRCLAEVAVRYAHAKLVCFAAALAGFDRDVLPVLLVYQRGGLVMSLVHVTDDLGDDFGPDEVEAFLVNRGALAAGFRTADRALEVRLRTQLHEAHGPLTLSKRRDDLDDD